MTSRSQFKRSIVQGRPAATWLCDDCAKACGGEFIEGHRATYHEDLCGVCMMIKIVTEPRNFRWPHA